ncbi:MAG: endonuclease [Arthrobacter sp.]|nr:endonuclease [Arthrobacter sp.]MCU1547774.1 endonuclease [Arthrobacter sp.]
MTAIILEWNPERWNGWNYDAVVEQVAETGQFLDRWSVGLRRNIRPGADAWLLLQGQSQSSRGLIGHGIVMSESYEAQHCSDPEDTTRYVSVAFDALLPMGEQIPPSALQEAVPGVPWKTGLRSSGTAVDPAAEPDLHRVWRELGPETASDPTQPVPGTYPEAAVSRVQVNRYERSPEARRVCLAFHGTSCAACGFSFEIAYGEIGRDFIHVHHVVPVSQLGSAYQLDPVTDLVPLCANCHAMAHRGVSTPRTVAELRRAIAAAGYLSGQSVDDRTLEAQDAARRILGEQ